MNDLTSGLGLILFSAICGGAFAVPLKKRQRYEWENTWLLGFTFALIIIPLITVSLVLPVWPSAVANAGSRNVLIAMAFGFLWGWGAVTFAVGINHLGLSLGFAIIMGINTAVGSTVPMMRRWGAISGPAKLVTLVGIAVCIVGVVLCGKAGALREKDSNAISGTAPEASSSKPAAGTNFLPGLFWCVLSGVLSACANLGFDFADRVAYEAQQLGAHPIAASFGRWLPVYLGGFLAILIGTGSTMFRKRTWKIYVERGTGRDLALAAIMGLLHFVSQNTYGIGAFFLGRLGTSVGWALNIAASLLVANGFGFLIGEWRSAQRRSVAALAFGLAVLVVAMVFLAYGSSLGN